MNMQSYPLNIALKNAGGRKTKANRHVRSARAKRRAFQSQAGKVVAQYQKKTGDKVPFELSDAELIEWSARDADFAKLSQRVFELRWKWLGY